MRNMSDHHIPMSLRVVAGVFASFITLVCACMAAISAFQRSPTLLGAVMFSALALAMVVGSHLLPAMARGGIVGRGGMWVGRAIFVVCVGVTLYNHAYFFDSEKRALGALRQSEVAPSTDVARYEQELALIAARALPVVSADMSNAKASVARAVAALERCSSRDARCTSAQATLEVAKAKVDALQDERNQALRAEDLRVQLATTVAAHTAKVNQAGANSVDASIANMAGVQADTVAMMTSVAQSIAIEVMGALFWLVALPRPRKIERKPKVQEVRIKHIVPYNPMPKAPRLIGWAKKALVHHQAQPRDSPVVLRPA